VLHGRNWLAQKCNGSLWSANEWIVFGVTHEPEALIELVGSWKRCLQVAERVRLIGDPQHRCEQGSPDSSTLDRGFDPNKCQVPMGVARMKLLHGSEPSEQATRSTREHYPHYSPLARSRSPRASVWLWSIRRHPGSNSDEVVIAVGGIDLADRKHFLKDGAEKRREGDAAPEAIVEEVSDDRVFGESAREQSTRSIALGAAQSSDVELHGVISRRDRKQGEPPEAVSPRPPNDLIC
jgi:hypothetical protein